MSLQKLLSYVGNKNLAKGMDQDDLNKIALDVIETTERDLLSMKDWCDSVDKGIELCKAEYQSKDDPWPDAANFKSDILTSAANDFGNRVNVELMRDPRLAKSVVIGADTIKNVIDRKMADIQRTKSELEPLIQQVAQMKEAGEDTKQFDDAIKKLQDNLQTDTKALQAKKAELRERNERADRVAVLMNWQINHGMEEWREDMGDMFYQLPNVGTLFKKTVYDETQGRCFSQIIKYPDFAINQQTESMDSCRSFTHIMAFGRAEYETRVKSGIWIDAKVYQDSTDLAEGTNEYEEVKKTEDNPNKFYEHYGWLDLDDDGVEEPYIITVHVSTRRVVRIVARYSEDNIIVSYENGSPQPLLKLQRSLHQKALAKAKEYGADPEIKAADDLTGFEVVRVKARNTITKYGLIPSFDGTFLDLGFYHIIGSTTMGVNKTTNDLINAGTLANTITGIISADFKAKQGGPLQLKQGHFERSDLTAAKLQGAIVPIQFKEPSQTLFALNEKLETQARTFTQAIDAGGQLQANTAPTTALAIVQESLIQHSAHITRIIRSMNKEFGVIFELLRDYFSNEDYLKITGDDEADIQKDFDVDGLSVISSANPEVSSKMQRMMLAQAEMEQVPMVIQAGGNPIPIIKNYYKRIGSENLDEIFPNEAEMSPEEKAQMQQMQQLQKQQNEMAQAQLRFTELQTELLKKGEERKDFEAQVNAQKTQAEIAKLQEQIEELKANTIYLREKAESEHVNNQLDIYTAISNEADKLGQITE